MLVQGDISFFLLTLPVLFYSSDHGAGRLEDPTMDLLLLSSPRKVQFQMKRLRRGLVVLLSKL
jgi:hypothetical protein